MFCTVPNLSRYCSMCQNFDTFDTPHEAWIVVFSVSNAKYLAFDTPNGSALMMIVFYHQIKTPIDFLYRRGLNHRSLIQPSKT